jgi:hypothetical protein
MTRTIFFICAVVAAVVSGMTPRVPAPHFGRTGFYEIAPSNFRINTFFKAVDTNADSFIDLIVVTPGATKVSVLFGDGLGKFRRRLDSEIDGIVYAGGNVAEGDFNSDGHPDLVIAMNRGPLQLMIGDGKGGFTAGPALQRVGPNPDCAGPLVAADVNRDGKLDIIASQCQDGIGIFLGAGNGTFATALRIPISGLNRSINQTMAVADFNKDGIPDIAIATLTGVVVLLGNGDGTFREPVPAAEGIPLKFITADVNRDGNVDLIVMAADPSVRPAPMFGSAGNSVNVYLGDGRGGFKPLPPISAALAAFSGEGGFPNHIEVADVNGDNIPDLVVSKQQYSYETDKTEFALLVLAGYGDGTFGPPIEFRNAGLVRKYPRFSFALADVNADRKPDLIFFDDVSGKQIGVALNTGKTKSTEPRSPVGQ